MVALSVSSVRLRACLDLACVFLTTDCKTPLDWLGVCMYVFLFSLFLLLLFQYSCLHPPQHRSPPHMYVF